MDAVCDGCVTGMERMTKERREGEKRAIEERIPYEKRERKKE